MSSYAASPPPLQHPIPRAPFHPPEPPRTPSSASPPHAALDRYPASPPPGTHVAPAYGQPASFYTPAQPSSHQPLGSMSSAPSSSSSFAAYHPQQPQQQPPLAQQQQAQHSQWNPMTAMGAMAAGGGPGLNDATAQMGLQFGSHALSAGQNYVNQTFTRHLPMPLLKHAFAVSNSYVLRKLGVLLWPWRHGSWARSVRRNAEGQGEGWASPREDLNAPDLYIPTMSIITYILLSALHSGLQARFHPEVLGLTASKALGAVLLEFMGIKLGTYLLDVKGATGSAWEVGFYGGYKFVGVIFCLLVDLLSPGRLVWWSCFLYVVAANAFFLLRSLKYILLPDPAQAFGEVGPAALAATVTHGQRTARVRFLVAVALWQVALMGALVWV